MANCVGCNLSYAFISVNIGIGPLNSARLVFNNRGNAALDFFSYGPVLGKLCFHFRINIRTDHSSGFFTWIFH